MVLLTAAADGPLRRQPTELEIASRCDFADMNDAWHRAVDDLVEKWAAIQATQRQQISTDVAAAIDAGDLDRLTSITVPTTEAANLLFGAMQRYALAAGAAQQREAEQQGVDVPEWSLDDEALTAAAIRDRLRQVATTTARLLGLGLVQSAVRRAVQLFGSGTGEEIAEQVDEHLAGLSDAQLREQIGAAITTAQNDGRIAVLNVAPEARYVATEIHDKNTCVAPEVLVTTLEGLVPAKEVTLDNHLLTHAGRWVKPSRIVVSQVEEDLVRVHVGDGRSVRLTWDHPVFVRSGGEFCWRNAGDLAVGDLVVDQSTLQIGSEPIAHDVALRQTPYDVSARDQIGRLSTVDMRTEAMPVGAVGFDDELLPYDEVCDPGAYLDLSPMDVAERFQDFADPSLNAGLSVTRPVATDTAVALAGSGRRDHTELDTAVLTVHEHRRPSASFRAVLSTTGEPPAEPGAASHAVGCHSPGIQAARQGAVVVPGSGGDRHAELSVTVGADLADTVSGRTQLGAQLGVGELALIRAVHGAHPLPPSDLCATQFAGRRREVRVLSQPSGPARAALAERAALDRSTACRTRLVHDLSVQVSDPNFLVITGTERQAYAGEVYDFTVPKDETFWAEGVLVHNCSPCSDVDGTEYASLTAARAAYPSGGYVNCLGGSRCRGTLVAVWPQGGEQAATGMILAASGDRMPPSNFEQGDVVPYRIVQDHPDCGADTPWAVEKEATGELLGCHATEAAAAEQRAALYAADGETPDDEHDNDEMPSMDYAGDTAPWEGVLAVEGLVTGDGREFAEGALTWADLPIPLRWNIEDSHGGEARTKAVNVGRIDKVWRDGQKIMGAGVLDLSDDNGQRAYNKIKGNFLRGVSIDADSISDEDVEHIFPDDVNEGMSQEDDLFEMLFAQPEKTIFHGGRIRAATLVDIPAFAEAYVALLDEAGAIVAGGQPVGEAALLERFGAVAVHDTGTSDEPWDHDVNEKRLASPMSVDTARNAYAWIDTDRIEDGTIVKDACKFLHHDIGSDGRPGAANLAACSNGIGILNGGRGGTDIPGTDRQGVYDHLAAHLRDADREAPPLQAEAKTVTAAAVWQPPAEWFADPKLSLPTPITITDEGRIYGHAAQWGSCHIGNEGACIQPPHEDAHPYYRTGEVVCADGSRVAVGQITVGTGHAPLHLGATPAAEHYDNTGAAVADVAVGNDAHGIWVAGTIRPGADPTRVYELQAAGQVSGDWRRIGGQLRLVGLLAVNVPGFPVPKMRARVASGQPQALVAAGRPTVAYGMTQGELEKWATRVVMRMLSRQVHPGGR